MKNNRKKGFTIVELVIVIAVIAILAAVLIPTFSNVISNAKDSSAKSQARNLWVQYTAANPETFADQYGYIRVLKSGTTDQYYYFVITAGQIDTKPVAQNVAEASPTATVPAGKKWAATATAQSDPYKDIYLFGIEDVSQSSN